MLQRGSSFSEFILKIHNDFFNSISEEAVLSSTILDSKSKRKTRMLALLAFETMKFEIEVETLSC